MLSKLLISRLSSLITLALIVAGYALFLLNAWYDQQSIQRQEQKYISQMLRQSATAVFSQHAALLRTVGYHLSELEQDQQLMAEGPAYLQKVHALNPGMAGFGYARLDGQLLLVSNVADQQTLPNLMENPVSAAGFRQALAGKRLSLGQPYYMELLDHWLMPIRVPVEDASGRVHGVMTAGYTLDSAESDWLALARSSGSQLAMVSEQGYWQFRTSDTHEQTAHNYREPVPDILLHTLRRWDEQGQGDITWQGEGYLVASAHMPAFNMYALSYIPHSELRIHYLQAILPSVPLLSAVLILWWLASRLIRRTELKRRQAEHQARQLAQVVNQNTHALAVLAPDGQFEYRNQRFRERLPGVRTFAHLWPKSEQHQWREAVDEALHDKAVFSRECQLSQHDNRWYQVRVTPLNDGQQTARKVLALEDINEHKHAELQLYHQVHYDLLTGLPNRAHTLELLEQAMQEARRNEHGVLVCYLDLDEFKQLNDYYGHHFADRALKQLANYLRLQLGEQGQACHMSADEFLVFLPYRDNKACLRLLHRLDNLLRFNLEVDGQQLDCRLSGGYCQYQQGNQDASALISCAELALRQAKEHSRTSLVGYSAEMGEQLNRKHRLQQALERALVKGALTVSYQGKYSARHSQLVGFEALVRWQDPEFGWVSPAEFIPLAEEHGLIERLGRFVLDRACADLCQLRSASGLPLTVAVNISVRQLRPALITEIEEVLARYQLPGSALEIELTESLWAQNFSAAHQVFERMLALGVRLSIDDFGTGYSSLSYLSRFPVDCLKIDRTFVSEMDTKDNDRNVVAGIIALGHSLSLDVVAEGVETDAQRTLLSEMGCDQLQGFLLSRPQPLQELLKTF